ncbi:Peptidoglycan/LPS O-acetylase OafA/YrhL, contains acyltransferase and SGNH-hydrolase domains [Bryocella elongata]|uniref:Peptidoglycan/LPS O-acetylase OafA/YrhL, contains acyltransferase and SGNH-hydrolase domains n=1 Tax=Bryocella elongata TaxID=863522 RepID=A0A1H6BZ64_9BACT|nr:acyltransferase [Bryocella elongata]SEG65991.1 Peptidoglycan/LPS O-acetylase OafA/YrhL, contains acyltransferase and SGNH-hydrolase domains [Bryocella elongata]
MPKEQTGPLVNLDFVRSFAVALVVISHASGYAHRPRVLGYDIWFFGILGVCIFFVHTTLVLMWSLQRDADTLSFYLRRIFRLWPLWAVVFGLYLGLHIAASPYYAFDFRYFAPRRKEVLANILLVFNLVFGANVVGASWSLPVEMQMYVLLPFLFAYVRAHRLLWPLLVLDALLCLTAYTQLPAINTSLLFCGGLFLPGAMAYVLFQRERKLLPSFLFPPWVVALVLAVNTWGSKQQNSIRGGWILCLLLGLSLPHFREMQSAVIRNASAIIARYSYSIYLAHIPCLAVAMHYWPRGGTVERTLVFFVTLTASCYLLYHLIEAPFIRVGARIARRLNGRSRLTLAQQTTDLNPAP